MKFGENCVKALLCPLSLGVAFGVVKGVSLMVLALAGTYYGYGLERIQHISVLIHGYAPSVAGSLWGLLWGLICGFVFGFILALIYNWCLCCCKKSCSNGGSK